MKNKLDKIVALLLLIILALPLTSSFCVFAEDDSLFDENMVYEFTDTVDYKSASAGTTSSGKDAVFIDGGEATYEIPAVPETGWYMVSVSTKTNVNKKATYTITGSVGEDSWSNKIMCSPASRTVNIGSFYLEEGTPADISFSFSFAITSGSLPSVTLTDIKVTGKSDIPVPDSDETVIPALDYTNRVFRQGTTDDESPAWGSSVTGDLTSWSLGKATVENKSYGLYDVNFDSLGIYEVYAYLSGKLSTTVSFSADGEETVAVNSKNPGDYNTVVETKVCDYQFEAGHHTLRFNFSATAYFLGFKIVPKTVGGDLELDSVVFGETELIDGASISKGTDYLELNFNYDVDENTVNENNITLSSSDESKVPMLFETEGKKVTLIFKETLKENGQYYLKVSGIAPVLGNAAPIYEYSYVARGTDGEKGTIICDSVLNDHEDVALSYTVKSSKDIGIKGKKVSVYRLAPNQTEEVFVGEAVSGEDGVLEINDVIPEGSIYGSYKYIAKSDYCDDLETSIVYVSKERENELMEMLEETTAETVTSFFENNQTELGISIENDLANIPDKSKVYRHFIGKEFPSIDDFNLRYTTAIYLETINAAEEETKNEVEVIICDRDAQLLLGLKADKLNIILENNKDTLIDDIISLDEIDSLESASLELNKVIEENFALVFGQKPVKLSEKTINIYSGQSLELPLELSEEVTNVTEIILIVSSSDASFEKDDVTIETPKKAEVTYSWKEDVLTATIKFEVKSTVSDFGSIILNADESDDEYSVDFEGNVVCDLDLDKNEEYNIEENIPVNRTIKKSTFAVSVSPSPSSDKNNTQTSRPAGGSGGSKPSANVPQITPVVKPDVPEIKPDIKFEFEDISEVSWAQDSINTLLDLGVVSESPDKKFNPNNNIKRSEFIKLIIVALDLTDETAKASFTDVAENAWYYSYVASAQKAGIVYGDDSGAFNPDSFITRQDMSVMIERAMKKKGVTFGEPADELFADDASISAYAKNAVYNLKDEGIINGTGNNNFSPLGLATRAQAAKMICEMIKVVG